LPFKYLHRLKKKPHVDKSGYLIERPVTFPTCSVKQCAFSVPETKINKILS